MSKTTATKIKKIIALQEIEPEWRKRREKNVSVSLRWSSEIVECTLLNKWYNNNLRISFDKSQIDLFFTRIFIEKEERLKFDSTPSNSLAAGLLMDVVLLAFDDILLRFISISNVFYSLMAPAVPSIDLLFCLLSFLEQQQQNQSFFVSACDEKNN